MPLQKRKERGYILRSLVLPVLCAVIVLLFRLNVLPSGFMFFSFLAPVSDFFIIVASGLCGGWSAFGMFWLIFATEMVVRGGDVFELFPLFLYMIASLTSETIARYRWYTSLRRTLLACVIFILEIGIMLFITLGWIYGIEGLSLPESIIGGIPECVAATAVMYLYFRFAPDRIKKSFGLGWMYASDYVEGSEREWSPISRYIFTLSVIEGILSGLVSVLMVNALYPFMEDVYIGNPDHKAGRALILAIGFFFTSILSLSIALVVNEFIIGLVVRLVRRQEQLQTELAVSIEGNKAKTAFFSNMTHELRSPINAVLGMDEMILRESNERTIRGYAENIKSAGAMLLALINDLLDMSKIEVGKMEIVPAEYETKQLVNDLVVLIEQRAAEKSLTFSVDIDPALPKKLYGDEIRIKQVITNILTNAVKYTERGSVTLSIAKMGDDGHRTWLDCHVIDTGIGIKEEDIGKLFHEFERIEERRNRNIEGTGLGINITMSLLEMMDSRLEVESVYGEGSDFHFVLQQDIADAEPMGEYTGKSDEAVPYRQGFTAADAKILVADDTPMNLEVMKNLLKRTQIQIDTVAGGEEFLSRIGMERYDILFLDDRMPGLSGVETFRRMRETEHRNEGVPVVILTANTATDAKALYEKEGFSQYLSKPIDAEVLEETLLKFLPEEKVRVVEVVEADEGDTEDGVELAKSGVAGTMESASSTKGSTENTGDLAKADVARNVKSVGSVKADTAKTRNVTKSGIVDTMNLVDATDSVDAEMLALYLDAIENTCYELCHLYEQKDWENYTVKVHSLKSTSRMIGETELANLAERMETAGDANDIDFLNDNHLRLVNWYRSMAVKYQVVAEAKEEISAVSAQEEETSDDRPLLSEEETEAAFAAIHELAQVYDDVSIEGILVHLEGYRLTERYERRLAEVKRAFAKLEWELL